MHGRGVKTLVKGNNQETKAINLDRKKMREEQGSNKAVPLVLAPHPSQPGF